jgi:uncharacterized protein YkwD
MGRHRRAGRSAAPVRTGLLGASAAFAVGALAVTGGLIPGQGRHYTVGSPEGPAAAGGTGQSAGLSPSSAAPATLIPAPRPSPTSTADSGHTAAPRASRSAPRDTAPAAPRTHSPAPSQSAAVHPPTPDRTQSASPAAAAEAQVLRLVNDARTQAGCHPLDADPALAGLAGDYSVQMAREGFFSHTDPDGLSPWDRARAAGITDLGGENIARGQQDAQAVMDAWMHSPGHRANILNCDFTELGVGVHFGPGGPWWTQDFGY